MHLQIVYYQKRLVMLYVLVCELSISCRGDLELFLQQNITTHGLEYTIGMS
jgi:hypothetical protein